MKEKKEVVKRGKEVEKLIMEMMLLNFRDENETNQSDEMMSWFGALLISAARMIAPFLEDQEEIKQTISTFEEILIHAHQNWDHFREDKIKRGEDL